MLSHGGNVSPGAWSLSIIRKWLLPLAVVFGQFALVLYGSVTPCHAQAGLETRLGSGDDLTAPLLDESHARSGYRIIENWLGAGEIGAQAARPILVSDLAAVQITLRWGGMALGQGEVILPSVTDGRSQVIDLTQPLAEATRQAMTEFQGALLRSQARSQTAQRIQPGQPARADQSGPGDPTETAQQTNDAPSRLTVGELMKRGVLLLDLQIARSPEPLNLPADASVVDIYRSFSPGFHGLVLSTANPGLPAGQAQTQPARSGTAVWRFPADSLARNVTPDRMIRQMLNQLGYEAAGLAQLKPTQRPAIHRFEVIHLVRPAPQEPVLELVRGNVPLSLDQIDAQTLDAMVDRLTAHIRSRVNDLGQLAGVYQPTSDSFDPPVAQDHDVALTAYVLAKRGEQIRRSRDFADTGPVDQAVDRLVRDLRSRILTAETPRATGTRALVLLTLLESHALADRKALRDALADRLLRGQDQAGWFEGTPSRSALTDQALAATAMAKLYQKTRREDARQAANKAINAIAVLMNRSDVPAWPAQRDAMSWVLAAAQAMSDMPKTPNEADASPASLMQLKGPIDRVRAEILAHLVRDAPTVGPDDVVGGVDEAVLRPGEAPYPDWRTAHDLAFLAAYLNTQPDDQQPLFDDIAACAMMSRYLARLMFDGPACFYVRYPEQALGGVRLALWDNRLAAEPQAMTLLALMEFQRAGERMTQRMAEQEIAPDSSDTPSP